MTSEVRESELVVSGGRFHQNGGLLETSLRGDGISFLRRGKVRDIYRVGDHLLIVATDRISVSDVVLGTPIPGKGEFLTQISLFWFRHLKEKLPHINNHLFSTDIGLYPTSLQGFSEILKGRSMLVKPAQVVPVECVVRGYLSGSGWKSYQECGEICEIKLDTGLQESDKLPEPIFTPATKAESGHDKNISYEEMTRVCRRWLDRIQDRNVLGPIHYPLELFLQEYSLTIYQAAAEYALGKGIIIADTKFEFGMVPFDDRRWQLILVDEVLTPDSSRFWDAKKYEPGRPQESLDKQFVRNYCARLDKWNGEEPGPELPDEIVQGTVKRYQEICQRLLG